MSDVKLSRRALEAALAALEPEHQVCIDEDCCYTRTVLDAARALLRVMQPASDEEVGAAVADVKRALVYVNPPDVWRAAEARARRIAGWVDELGEEGR